VLDEDCLEVELEEQVKNNTTARKGLKTAREREGGKREEER